MSISKNTEKIKTVFFFVKKTRFFKVQFFISLSFKTIMSETKKQLIGPAEDQIRALLSQSGDPLGAIRAIQHDYGLDLKGIENMYPLLELCGYSRLEIHGACLNALNKAAVEKIESSSFQLEK